MVRNGSHKQRELITGVGPIPILVIIGATKDGRKELVAIEDEHRESKLSGEGVLTNLKRRRLKEAPALAIGGLGFWIALEEVFP